MEERSETYREAARRLRERLKQLMEEHSRPEEPGV